jgi:hypothetical protein
MNETTQLRLPLVAASQAQKHITVNEAFQKLDATVQLVLTSVGAAAPPGAPAEGDVHAVGDYATGAWSGQSGHLALFINGGWLFLQPMTGWRAWRQDSGSTATFDGVDWIDGVGSISANGAAFVHRATEIDHSVAAGPTSVVSGAVPENAIVYGVTGRVMDAVGGAASFQVGVSDGLNRYGSGIGVSSGSWLKGMTGTPLAYYASTDLVLTAEGGSFSGAGTIRLVVHWAELTLPRGRSS